MIRSEFILGRIDTRAKLRAQNGEATLSAYRTKHGRLRYTIANRSTPPAPSVMYRIHVRLK